jgi:HD-like signal output (HDOD) protein
MVAATTEERVDMNSVLAGAQLPALPQSAVRILELSHDQKNGATEYAIPIEADPGLAGQVLRFVNSAYFGFAREISSVKLAITMVGVHTIKNFALWSAVFSLMPNPKCGPFDLRSLWQDSLRRALFARAFAKLLGVRDAEPAFAAALLQDMAVPLLAKERSSDYVDLLQRREGDNLRLSQLEKERFGWTHADAAAEMSRLWNLPEDFADLIEHHTHVNSSSPDAASNQDVQQSIDRPEAPPRAERLAVALSSLLPAVSDNAWHDYHCFAAGCRQWCPTNGPTIGKLLEAIDLEFADFAPVLKITTPSKSLSDRYAEASTSEQHPI